MKGNTFAIWLAAMILFSGIILGMLICLLPRRHRPPCKNGEVEIFYYNTHTGEHFSNCTYIIPSR